MELNPKESREFPTAIVREFVGRQKPKWKLIATITGYLKGREDPTDELEHFLLQDISWIGGRHGLAVRAAREQLDEQKIYPAGKVTIRPIRIPASQAPSISESTSNLKL